MKAAQMPEFSRTSSLVCRPLGSCKLGVSALAGSFWGEGVTPISSTSSSDSAAGPGVAALAILRALRGLSSSASVSESRRSISSSEAGCRRPGVLPAAGPAAAPVSPRCASLLNSLPAALAAARGARPALPVLPSAALPAALLPEAAPGPWTSAEASLLPLRLSLWAWPCFSGEAQGRRSGTCTCTW